MVRVPDAKSDCSRQGEAEVLILNFETTWSEFQMPSQADCSYRGEAEVRVLNFKTTFSEFQIPSQNNRAKAKPRYVFRVSSPPRVGPKQLCALAHLGCTRAAGTS